MGALSAARKARKKYIKFKTQVKVFLRVCVYINSFLSAGLGNERSCKSARMPRFRARAPALMYSMRARESTRRSTCARVFHKTRKEKRVKVGRHARVVILLIQCRRRAANETRRVRRVRRRRRRRRDAHTHTHTNVIISPRKGLQNFLEHITCAHVHTSVNYIQLTDFNMRALARRSCASDVNITICTHLEKGGWGLSSVSLNSARASGMQNSGIFELSCFLLHDQMRFMQKY